MLHCYTAQTVFHNKTAWIKTEKLHLHKCKFIVENFITSLWHPICGDMLCICPFVTLHLLDKHIFLFKQISLHSSFHLVSLIRHVPLWLAQLFKSYEMSNVTGWEGNDSSPHPPINIPLHPTCLSSVDAHWGTKIAGAPGCAFIVHRVRETQNFADCYKCVGKIRPNMAKMIFITALLNHCLEIYFILYRVHLAHCLFLSDLSFNCTSST